MATSTIDVNHGTGHIKAYPDGRDGSPMARGRCAVKKPGWSTVGRFTHGAGAVRFDTKVEGGPIGEGGERYYNFVRCVRDE